MDKLLKINEIFKNVIDNIKSVNRKRKISLSDAIYYRFLYSKINTTKKNISSRLNYENNMKADRTSYERKENNIPLSLYEDLFKQIKDLYGKEFSDKDYLKKKKLNCVQLLDYKIIATDGTYGNTNTSMKKELETSLNMVYYDISNGIPIDLTFEGSQNKNKEIDCLIKYIKNKGEELKNVIFVLDRAYFKYELFKMLNENGFKYVIRIRDNAKLESEIKITNKNKEIMEHLKTTSRIVNYNLSHDKKVKTKNNTVCEIRVNHKYKLITNLTDKLLYPDSLILNIYNNRWDVETFIKLIKKNCKLDIMSEKDFNNYKKMYLCELIIVYISRMIAHAQVIYIKQNRKIYNIIHRKDNKLSYCDIRVNDTNIINGIYDILLKHFIYSSLTTERLTLFANSYVEIIKNERNRSSERTCKIPFKKWYVKGYHTIYKYTKIIESIKNNKKESLNKNLKTISKNINIRENS